MVLDCNKMRRDPGSELFPDRTCARDQPIESVIYGTYQVLQKICRLTRRSRNLQAQRNVKRYEEIKSVKNWDSFSQQGCITKVIIQLRAVNRVTFLFRRLFFVDTHSRQLARRVLHMHLFQLVLCEKARTERLCTPCENQRASSPGHADFSFHIFGFSFATKVRFCMLES